MASARRDSQPIRPRGEMSLGGVGPGGIDSDIVTGARGTFQRLDDP